MILYDKPECPFCWKVRLALHESGYAAELIDSQDLEHRSHWQALTPKKTVPVLVTDGGDVIYESNVILEYLAETGNALLPATPGARIQARLLNSYSDTVVGPALREIIFEKRDRPRDAWDMDRIKAGELAFEEALDYLAAQLGQSDYFATEYSFPECALTARFGLAEAYGAPIPDRYGNLQRWFKRMKQRPSYRATEPSWKAT
ncbi:glutathione S-transferase family protein [Marinobacterium litorale]|uniref:glutathione S-transferase family protein n=1 Tax=Marinobacterium litorale TaxID=404770 RepID=UPI00040C95D2|nr:glutathione S-transferase family protein [Marinobacterium litorale]